MPAPGHTHVCTEQYYADGRAVSVSDWLCFFDCLVYGEPNPNTERRAEIRALVDTTPYSIAANRRRRVEHPLPCAYCACAECSEADA